MQLDILDRRPLGKGRTNVTVRVIRPGAAPEQLDVEIPEPVGSVVMNMTGHAKTVSGEWLPVLKNTPQGAVPFFDPSIEWARQPVTDDVLRKNLLSTRILRSRLHQYIADSCKNFKEFTLDGVRVVPKGSVHVDPKTGMVEVQVEAYDAASNKKMFVHDGIYQFDRMPTLISGVEDPQGSLKKYLVRVIRQQNGLEVR